MKYKFSFLIILSLLISSTHSQAQDKNLSFVIFNFITENSSDDFVSETSSIIKNKLSEEKYFKVISADKKSIIGPDCDSNCQSLLNQLYKDKICVIGSIKIHDIKSGEKVISKYVDVDINSGKYQLVVKVINLKNKKTELTFKKELSDKKQVTNEALTIAGQIRKFYLQKIPVEKNITKDTPENNESGSFIFFKGLTILPSFLYSMGRYSNIGDYGYGLAITLNSTLNNYHNVFFDLNINGYVLDKSGDNVKQAQFTSIYLYSGYSFGIFNNFNLSPSIGPGYNLHVIKGNKDSSAALTNNEFTRDYYYNPSLNTGIELSYAFTEDYNFVFRPSWNIIFEKNNYSNYLLLNLGIKFLF